MKACLRQLPKRGLCRCAFQSKRSIPFSLVSIPRTYDYFVYWRTPHCCLRSVQRRINGTPNSSLAELRVQRSIPIKSRLLRLLLKLITRLAKNLPLAVGGGESWLLCLAGRRAAPPSTQSAEGRGRPAALTKSSALAIADTQQIWLPPRRLQGSAGD